MGLIGFGLYYIGLWAHNVSFDEQLNCFEGEVDFLIFQKFELLLIFFRLPTRFLTRYFRLYYRCVHYLAMLISHSIVLACFCFKISFIHLIDLVFFSFCIASGAELSFASVYENFGSSFSQHFSIFFELCCIARGAKLRFASA